jgi:predicted RNA methylase
MSKMNDDLCLFEAQPESIWTNDDWQTPTEVAKKIAGLIKDSEITILEPAAGTGQIVRKIGAERRLIMALEKNQERVRKGRRDTGNESICWDCADFLNYKFHDRFDLIVGNPPFSLRMEFINRSLELLESNGRILFLLPIDFYCGKKMGDRWNDLNCHIHRQYTVQHRIAYLDRDGVPRKGRQVYDAVFDIRLGKRNPLISFL